MDTGNFDVDEKLKEISQHGVTNFPVGIAFQTYNYSKSGNVVLHWHEELQFVLQHTARSLYTVSDQQYVLEEGDALFINSGILHSASPLDKPRSSYICINLHPRLLYGFGNDLINQNFVMPLLSSTITAVHINGAEYWHKDIKKLLEEFVDVFERKDFAYELEIQKLTIEIWLLLLRNLKDKLTGRYVATAAEQARLDKITSFIHDSYLQELTLKDIASSGNVSESECCHLFSRLTGITPMKYLSNYRLIKSTELLAATDRSITEIAHDSGFSTASYYAEKFKKLMNCTPLEYRKRFSVPSVDRR